MQVVLCARRELEYVLQDAGVSAVLCTSDKLEQMEPLAHAVKAQLHVIDSDQEAQGSDDVPDDGLHEEVSSRLHRVEEGTGSLIIYTSGTTGKPKGRPLHMPGNVKTLNQPQARFHPSSAFTPC